MKLHAVREVFLAALKLGLTSFGGPTAHLSHFRREYVERRKWLDDSQYADLVALCQFLPGPASSQTGMGIGLMRAGPWGALAAWLGFTLPSALIMVLASMLMMGAGIATGPLVGGLGLLAVAVVGQAILGMGPKLVQGPAHAGIAGVTVLILALHQSALTQVLVLLAAGGSGILLFRRREAPMAGDGTKARIPLPQALGSLAAFLLLLAILPVVALVFPGTLTGLADAFYRAGALVFGGGHVVLPLLEQEVVATGLASQEAFLAAYGLAQAVPGPMFTLSAFVGHQAGSFTGAVVALLAVFLPSFLLIAGVYPFWSRIRTVKALAGAMDGIGAAVTGFLVHALYDPLWTNAITGPARFAAALCLFLALVRGRVPVWILVPAAIAAGYVMTWAGI